MALQDICTYNVINMITAHKMVMTQIWHTHYKIFLLINYLYMYIKGQGLILFIITFQIWLLSFKWWIIASSHMIHTNGC